MNENSTIVIPIQFKSHKGWRNFDKQIFKTLNEWSKDNKFKWKRVNYLTEKIDECEVSAKTFFDANIEKLEGIFL